jgi:hypothetical protein
MQRTHDSGEVVPVSEMAIVDTFTKLIFGEEDDYSARELMIIQAFRSVDDNVLRDSHRDMGEYLRNLGVREMIQVVARVREFILEGGEVVGLPDRVRLKSRRLTRRIR